MANKKPLIAPSKRGALHQELGVPAGQKIGKSKLEAAKRRAAATGSTTLAKRVQFALNFNKNKGR